MRFSGGGRARRLTRVRFAVAESRNADAATRPIRPSDDANGMQKRAGRHCEVPIARNRFLLIRGGPDYRALFPRIDLRRRPAMDQVITTIVNWTVVPATNVISWAVENGVLFLVFLVA